MPKFLFQALAQARMNSLVQLSRALNDARVEKEAAIAQAVAQTKAEKLEAAADERQEQLIKVDKKSYLLTLSKHRSRTAKAISLCKSQCCGSGKTFISSGLACTILVFTDSTVAWLFTPELRPLFFWQVCIKMMKCIVKLKPTTI